MQLSHDERLCSLTYYLTKHADARMHARTYTHAHTLVIHMYVASTTAPAKTNVNKKVHGEMGYGNHNILMQQIPF